MSKQEQDEDGHEDVEIQVLVRYMPCGTYLLTSQPSRIVMGTVKDLDFVQNEILALFGDDDDKDHDACRLNDELIEVSTRKSLTDLDAEILRIIGKHRYTIGPNYAKPADLNYQHYST